MIPSNIASLISVDRSVIRIPSADKFPDKAAIVISAFVDFVVESLDQAPELNQSAGISVSPLKIMFPLSHTAMAAQGKAY
jgi:hypothetical protein